MEEYDIIISIFRESEMYREIEKIFDPDSIPDFEDDFYNIYKKIEKEIKEIREC